MSTDINELGLMTATDLAQMLGVSRAWAHELSLRDGFPSPVYRTRSITLWHATSVKNWAKLSGYMEEY